MSNSRLRVLSSLSAFPPLTKNSSELERVVTERFGLANMVGCEKPDFSDDSSLSSVSSEELDIMGSESEDGGRGKDKRKSGKVNDSFLACHEVKFPSDSEEGGEEKRDVGRGRGRRIERVDVGGSRRGRAGSLGKVGVPGWFGVGGGGQRGTLGLDPNLQYNQHPRLGKATLFSVPRRGDSPPVPLGGFKSTTMSRVNPGLSASLIEISNLGDGGGKEEPRKRRPRLDASLKICSNFVNDVLSKKHKAWVWPLYKPDRGKDSVFRDPIYLVDIKTKLADRKYSRPEEFAADMRKLIGNYCRYYNASHQYHHSAKQLQELFEQEFKRVQEMPHDGSKWVVGGVGYTGAEVRGKRFKDCIAGGSPQLPCTPVPSTPLVDSSVVKKVVAMAANKWRGGSLGAWVPEGGQVGSPVNGGSESVVEDRDVGRVSEGRVDWVGCSSSEVVPESTVNATLSVLKVEANEEVVGEGSSVESNDGKDEVAGGVKRGADVMEDEGGGGKRRKVGEESGERGVEDLATTHTDADVKIKPVCKWIIDGFNIVPVHEQESLLREIRGAVGMDQLDIDGVVLGTLSGEDLSILANLIVGALSGVRLGKSDEDLRKGVKVASEVISTAQSSWHKMQQDLSSIRDTTYATLIKINHMQEFSFETLNDLHERKNNLAK